jgi:hypothetical protein
VFLSQTSLQEGLRMPDVSAPPLRDRVLRWPFYAGIVIVVFMSFVLSWPVAATAFSLFAWVWAPSFAFWVVIVLGFAVWAFVRSVRGRHWRSALSTLALPALIVASLPIANLTDVLVNQMHYLIFRSEYLSSIEKESKTAEGRLRIFDWGGNVMIGFNRFLVFDESDEIMLPPAQRSDTFKKKLRAHGFMDEERFRQVQSVDSHFYVVDCCW